MDCCNDSDNIDKSNNNIEFSDDTEIKDNTVESKMINQFTKNNNILNRMYYENNTEYKTLMEYIKPNKLTKDSNKKSNITCPGGRYLIQVPKIFRFFEMLKTCANKKLVLHFRELQYSDFNTRQGSGMMFDFDLLQKEEKNELREKNFNVLITKIFKVFKKIIKINDGDEIYFSIIMKQKMVYKEEIKMYKNGFHLIIPSIQLTKSAKRLIYNELVNDDELSHFFKSEFKNDIKEVFDMGSYSVPVYFLNNCKEDSSMPYKLFGLYKIVSSDYFSVERLNESIATVYNLVLELSLNFSGELIEKKYYDLHDDYHIKILNEEQNSSNFENEYEATINTFDTYESYVDENLNYYKKIVLEILDPKRAEDRNLWRDVIFAIANISPGMAPAFKTIAKLFSMRNEQKWNNTEFDKMWNEATSNNSTNKLTAKSLIYWAKIDNKEKFNKLSSKDIMRTIELDVYNRDNKILNGTLYQYHFAYYIHHLFKQKFICDIVNGRCVWYEFVLSKDSHIKGEVFKWREECRPDNLYLYISNRLPKNITKVIEKAEERIKNNPDDTTINEYVLQRTQKLRNSSQKLYTTDFKKGIIREAEVLFRSRGFVQKLNTDQNILGVGNGILELSENPKLIKYYHNYPISLYTDIDYEEYNINNPYIKTLLKAIVDLFPEDEIDAFHFLMYYLASCLDGKPKDSMILIITGTGSNGKSFLAELIKSVLGLYGKKMPLSFLTDSRSKSAGADESLMQLKTARLAYYSESNKQEVLNTAKLKEITSQETLSGRGIFEKQQNFRPTCHHMVTTNYHFSIKTTDHGIWRRIATYEFKITFTSNPDPNNKYEKKENTKLAKEFSYNDEIKKAFLSILMEYYKDLYRNHGGVLKNIMKPTIDKETSEYRNKEDTINRFIDDVCIYSPDNKTCISELSDKYEKWYEDNIDKHSIPIKSDILRQLLNSKIIKYVKKTNYNVILHNIRLKDDLSESDELNKDETYIKDMIQNMGSEESTYDYKKFNPLNL